MTVTNDLAHKAATASMQASHVVPTTDVSATTKGQLHLRGQTVFLHMSGMVIKSYARHSKQNVYAAYSHCMKRMR